jgi:hypothetical protein
MPENIRRLYEPGKASNAGLQRPGDNYASGKLSMRDMLIPVRCKRLLCGVQLAQMFNITSEAPIAGVRNSYSTHYLKETTEG